MIIESSEPTALEVAKRISAELALPAPHSLEDLEDENSRRLLASINQAGRHLRNAYSWAILKREAEVKEDLDEEGAFFRFPPLDVLRLLSVEILTRDNKRHRLIEGADLQIVTKMPIKSKGVTSVGKEQLICVYERGDEATYLYKVKWHYITKTWVYPSPPKVNNRYKKGDIVSGFREYSPIYELFRAKSSFMGQEILYLDRNALKSGGVSGDWEIYGNEYSFSPYEDAKKDTDIILLDQDAIVAGAKYKFRELQGLSYQEFKEDYYFAIDNAIGREVVPIVDRNKGRSYGEFI